MLSYYIIDTETNGLSSSTHEIVQMSIVRCSDRCQLSRDIKAEYPERSSAQALQITNRSIQDIMKGLPKEEAVDLFHNFLSEDQLTNQHRIIVCHNSAFDRKFLFALWEKVSKEFPADLWLCTIDMMKEYAKIKGLGKIKKTLGASMELLKVGHTNRFHTAAQDAQNTFLLWEKLMQEPIDYLSLIKTLPHSNGEKGDISFDDFME